MFWLLSDADLMLSRSLTWARDWGGRRLSSILNWSALGWSPPLASVLRSSRDQSGESESLRCLRPDKHILLWLSAATCFCWQMWLGGVTVDRCCYNSIYCLTVCCSSDGRLTTDDDHWCHPPMAGTSCDRWQLLCQHWSLIGRQWPGDTNTGLLLAVTSLLWALYAAGELLTTAALHKTAFWLANSCICGLWLAEGDKGTSAILETAACSDRGLCGDGLHLHPFLWSLMKFFI